MFETIKWHENLREFTIIVPQSTNNVLCILHSFLHILLEISYGQIEHRSFSFFSNMAE